MFAFRMRTHVQFSTVVVSTPVLYACACDRMEWEVATTIRMHEMNERCLLLLPGS